MAPTLFFQLLHSQAALNFRGLLQQRLEAGSGPPLTFLLETLLQGRGGEGEAASWEPPTFFAQMAWRSCAGNDGRMRVYIGGNGDGARDNPDRPGYPGAGLKVRRERYREWASPALR